MKNVVHSPLVMASPAAQALVQDAGVYLATAPAERAALASARTRPRRGHWLLAASDPVRVEGNSLVVGSVAFRTWPEGAPEALLVSHGAESFALQPGGQIVSRAL